MQQLMTMICWHACGGAFGLIKDCGYFAACSAGEGLPRQRLQQFAREGRRKVQMKRIVQSRRAILEHMNPTHGPATQTVPTEERLRGLSSRPKISGTICWGCCFAVCVRDVFDV